MSKSIGPFGALGLFCATSFAAGTVYHVTDLGTLGGSTSVANAINLRGQVVGSADLISGVRHAFLFNGALIDLTPGDSVNSAANGINNFGQVVGQAQGHATLFVSGSRTDLGTMGETSSVATDINDAGHIVGYAGTYRAFIYSGSTMTDLGNFGSGTASASGIGAAGDISGSATATGGTHAFRTTGSGLTDLGTLGGKNSYGRDVNGLGQVVGESDLSSGSYRHAFRSSGGIMTDLGAIGNRGSFAMGINDVGDIVGYAGVSGGADHGFIHTGGSNYDLNYLLDGTSSAWEIWYAYDINDAGQIVGQAHHYQGYWRAVLLTPINLVSGVVNLQQFVGSPVGLSATFEVFRADGNLQESWTSALNVGGAFYHQMSTSIGAGTLSLRVKVGHWLSGRGSFTFGNATNIAVSVVNGDCNSNNYIGTDDYLILNAAFDTIVGDAGFDPRADLNGDGYVGTDDYLILNESFDLSGD